MAATIEELQQASGELNSRLDHLHEFLKIDDYLEKIAERFIFTVPGSGGRAAYSPAELTALTTIPATIEMDPAAAVKTAVSGTTGYRTIISGSLYLAGTALQILSSPEKVLDI